MIEMSTRQRRRLAGRLFVLLVAVAACCRAVAQEAAADPAAGDTFTRVHLAALEDPAVANQKISLDFEDVDLRVVVKTISDLTGVNFLIDENVKGTVTLISPQEIRLAEAWDVFLSILEVRGFAAVPSGNVVKIVQRAEAAKRNIETRVGANLDQIPQSDAWVTQIIPLEYASVREAKTLVEPLISRGGQMLVQEGTNTVIVIDTSSNVHRIVRVLKQFDVPEPEARITVLKLTNATARSVASQITPILQERYRSGGAAAAKGAPAVATAGRVPTLVPDARTNSLIIWAEPDATREIQDLVSQLDQPTPFNSERLHVVYLKNATAVDMVKPISGVLDTLTQARGSDKPEPLSVSADESTNSLLVSAAPQDFEIVNDIIEKLDIPREQVLVELRILEASEDALKDLGIDWSTIDQAVTSSVRPFGFTNFGLRSEASTGQLEGLGLGLWKRVAIGDDESVEIGAILGALARHQGVNILSTPHIVTSNHQSATILVGSNIPYVKESRVTETDVDTPTVIKSYDYKDVGISLTIKPHASKGGNVRLEIESTFSKLISSSTGNVADTPTTSKREAQTIVTIHSGNTVVIGGLIRDDTVRTVKKVPFLGDLPGVGRLFQRENNQTEKTNLLMFITPYVLETPEDMLEITKYKQQEMDRARSETDPATDETAADKVERAETVAE